MQMFFVYWVTSRSTCDTFSVTQGIPSTSSSHVAYSEIFHTEPTCRHDPTYAGLMKTRWDNAALMLDQRLRRWSNITPALSQRVFMAFCGSIQHWTITMLSCTVSYMNKLSMYVINNISLKGWGKLCFWGIFFYYGLLNTVLWHSLLFWLCFLFLLYIKFYAHGL